MKILEWDVEGTRTVVLVPAWGTAGAKFPVLVALHGRGEAVKPPALGAMGWPRDYAMLKAIERVRNPPVTASDLEGFVDSERLTRMNAQLKEKPFGGLIVVCPHMSDVNVHSAELRPFQKVLVDAILPRVRKETPALSAPGSTGIDGVSLGGAAALRIGLASDTFGAVGSLQAAVSEEHAIELTELAKAALARRPGLKLRLVTSHEDYFRAAIEKLSATWKSAGVAHDYADVPGPHDYAFNRGPGSFELLTWYDRTLSR
jgi:enterochelin esterase-like enzyme